MYRDRADDRKACRRPIRRFPPRSDLGRLNLLPERNGPGAAAGQRLAERGKLVVAASSIVTASGVGATRLRGTWTTSEWCTACARRRPPGRRCRCPRRFRTQPDDRVGGAVAEDAARADLAAHDVHGLIEAACEQHAEHLEHLVRAPRRSFPSWLARRLQSAQFRTHRNAAIGDAHQNFAERAAAGAGTSSTMAAPFLMTFCFTNSFFLLAKRIDTGMRTMSDRAAIRPLVALPAPTE